MKNDLSVYEPHRYVKLTHPEWSKNATIYQVNIRQFTKEGNFKSFEKHLDRIKDLGVDILWLMPIHPIGTEARKGTLGSGYSVRDYFDVNHEFGTLNDLKVLVKKIHEKGMYVILDWVANHSSRDNYLTIKHPEWYSKDRKGRFIPTPWYDWDDIIEFDYNNAELREYMTTALKYWVKECDIDGYRCDVAGFVPLDFWENTRRELDEIKPVFMLAEWESRDLLQKSFDMVYSWTLWDKMLQAINTGNLLPLLEWMAHQTKAFPADGISMSFIENHDKNAWEGNQFANFGPGLKAAIVMTVMVKGMPLIYGGQEAGLDRSLSFFDKDEIIWQEHNIADLYKTLFHLKHINRALWNAQYGGEMVRINHNHEDKVIAFIREKDEDAVITMINFSDENLSLQLEKDEYTGLYIDWFTKQEVNIENMTTVALQPWGYKVFSKATKTV
ncbi:TPA: alpha-amylase family glycosyl hydrolase [Klebsiella oxytoca]|uniref:alpha-amylase family glycosyl hydrolase n=1 Tax=Klebsiella pneumoniae TaxID=573 RepID=UPI000E2CC280|nr:alpha-amylase family glycosyl hydrolase [Klebsiella pneumoniae]HBM2953120.1 alpha-glucosidase C-terminal domain-containing protein [Klebsiella oxytoca]SYA67375.1 malto-oligosyltrehalose trehalohydrolase [Klebsiella pneumoniae]HBM3049304.1 alpha-glucosidase C-terminal domain-containing protein [Klebsiella oxytoca]HEC2166226.1 alpha-glucosidase C-terminal domain-containing protein [Klebsiella oxytoca]HEJ0077766.1 alpha-glucosidase C-terminal domain-containing protein [Klebsiella oxytoca]